MPDSTDPVYKLYCLVSLEAVKKMNGVRGKMMTQAGHAYLHVWWDAFRRFPDDAMAYQAAAMAYKITLAVEDEEALVRFETAYRGVCGVSLVRDRGLTVFKEPTVTCLGIGPLRDDLKGHDLIDLRPFA